jgi:hypothetical protein
MTRRVFDEIDSQAENCWLQVYPSYFYQQIVLQMATAAELDFVTL